MKIIKSSEKENQWVSISGLFSILMMIFLFLSIAYMGNIILKQNSQHLYLINIQNGLHSTVIPAPIRRIHTKFASMECRTGFFDTFYSF